MTSDDFNRFTETLGVSRAEVCRRLGISLNTGTKYAHGRVAIPRYIALACAALIRGIEPWPD